MPANSQLLVPGSPLPASSQPSGGSSLPADLLAQAAHRLGLICAVIAGLWIAELLLGHLVTPIPIQYPDVKIFRLFELTGGITLVVPLPLFGSPRRSRRDPRFLLNLGLAYEVL